MEEKSFYSAISKYYEKTLGNSAAIEAKFTRTNRLPFDCLAPHQEAFLLKAQETYCFKIPDNGIGQKPFDTFCLHKADALFIAIYYKPRGAEIFEIPIRDFIHTKYTSKEKSLHINDAKIIGKQIHL
ncbi:MAG: hypothetical protein KBD16_00715 [Candidatus Pacebacteria bacterium]|nr:hypothetical protein [Candidatus Paceibacterota bacterium]